MYLPISKEMEARRAPRWVAFMPMAVAIVGLAAFIAAPSLGTVNAGVDSVITGSIAPAE